MTDDEILLLADQYTENRYIRTTTKEMMIAFARVIESRTLTNQKAKWYQEGVEAGLRQALSEPDLLNQTCCECGCSGGYALYCGDCWSKANQWVGLTEEEIFEDEWWDEQTAYAVNKMLMERNK